MSTPRLTMTLLTVALTWVLPSLAESQTFRIDECVGGKCSQGRIHSVTVSSENFIVIIDPDRCNRRAYCPSSYESITVEDEVELHIDGYELGENSNRSFTIYIPRRYKTLYFYGINGRERSVSIDLRQYEVRAGQAEPAAGADAEGAVAVAANAPATPVPSDPAGIVAAVIGIEEYRYAPRALYAANDARAMRDVLIDDLGVPADNVLFRTNEYATKGELKMALSPRGWLGRNVQRDSRVVVYFSGHGTFDPDSREPVLVAYDIDPSFPSGGYPLAELIADLAALDVTSVTVVLDAAFTARTRSGALLQQGRAPKSGLSELNVPADMLLFLASGPQQTNGVSPEREHGLFTYYFTKGLRGEADADLDRRLTPQEMMVWLERYVPARASAAGGRQRPVLLGVPAGALLLGDEFAAAD